MGKPELFSQNEGLANGDHRNAEDHVVADFRRLTGATVATMDDAPRHRFQNGAGLRKGVRTSTGHEGQGAGFRTAHPARNRCVDGEKPVFCSDVMRLAGRLHVDGGGIDEERALVGLWRDVGIDGQNMLSGRQHGDHDLRILHRCCRARHDRDGIFGGGLEIFRNQVEAKNRVPGLDEIGCHGIAHIAETDECNACHMFPPGAWRGGFGEPVSRGRPGAVQ